MGEKVLKKTSWTYEDYLKLDEERDFVLFKKFDKKLSPLFESPFFKDFSMDLKEIF